MSNKIEIEVKLCQEDRSRLDKLIEALTPQELPACTYIAPQMDETEPVKEIDQPAENVQQSEPQNPAPWDEDKPDIQIEAAEQPEQTVSLSEVQRKVVELSAAGHKDKVREIVTSYAERVSAIPEDKLAEVMDKLTALEG